MELLLVEIRERGSNAISAAADDAMRVRARSEAADKSPSKADSAGAAATDAAPRRGSHNLPPGLIGGPECCRDASKVDGRIKLDAEQLVRAGRTGSCPSGF